MRTHRHVCVLAPLPPQGASGWRGLKQETWVPQNPPRLEAHDLGAGCFGICEDSLPGWQGAAFLRPSVASVEREIEFSLPFL